MTIVPPNGLILLTGVNGYIPSVTAKELLDRGYRVRGTVRDVSKFDWMPSYYGPSFSLAAVPEFSAPGAFTEAVKGVDGIIHMGFNVSLQPDPKIVDPMVKSTLELLNAAANEPSVKRVVLTSAKAACMNEYPGVKYKITADTWNDEAVDAYNKPEEYGTHNPVWFGMLIYGAAKVLSERAALDFMRDRKPNFVLNRVLPNVNFGKVVAQEHLGFKSSGSFVNAMDKGFPLGPALVPNQWYVNTTDTVLLHLGALTLEDVKNERLMAMAGRFAWNDIINILRKRYPDRKTMVSPGEEKPLDLGEVDNTRSVEVLRMMGSDGFKSLEDSVVESMESVLEADNMKVARNRTDDVIDMIFKGAA